MSVVPQFLDHRFSQHSKPCYSRDIELLNKIQSGDMDALGKLFMIYSRAVFRLGVTTLKDTDEANDLVNEVFIYVWEKCNLYDPCKGTVRAWLVRVSYHRALDHRKYLSRFLFPVSESVEEYNTDNMDLIVYHDSMQQVEQSYWNGYFKDAFKSLTEEQQITLRLHFFEGLTINEIANSIGKTRGQVRHFYYRGLESLRAYMEKRQRDRIK